MPKTTSLVILLGLAGFIVPCALAETRPAGEYPPPSVRR